MFFHADLHAGSRVRVFAQVKAAEQIWRPGPPRGNDVDHLDLHQGFAEVKLNEHVSVRAGRQELLFGSTRLTGVREGPNVRIAFDTVRAIFRPVARWRVDAFAAPPTLTRPGLFDDWAESGRTFWGLYGARRPAAPGRTGLDLYYFGIDRASARFHRFAGRERRHSFGARLHRLVSERNRADFDWEWGAQTGSVGAVDLRAWYAASESGYSFRDAPLRPRVGLKLNAASGRSPFNPLFPDTRDFREQAFPGPANLTIVRPFTELRFRALVVTAGVDWFWRTSIRDGIYSFGTARYTEVRRGSTARFVGTKPALVAQYALNRHWTMSVIGARLFGGAYVRDALAGKSPAYAGVVLLLRL